MLRKNSVQMYTLFWIFLTGIQELTISYNGSLENQEKQDEIEFDNDELLINEKMRKIWKILIFLKY